ncbi:MAG: hypothetical protein GWP91_01080, partial [Rhodobacterales bacterium]|nr:hypothetical protein [Rhodobacterales bacterium]
MHRTIFGIALLTSLPSAANAATFTVCAAGCDGTDIKTVVDMTTSGDTVEVDGGNYVIGTKIFIDNLDVTIIGVDLPGGGAGRPILTSTVSDMIDIWGNSVVSIIGLDIGPGQRCIQITDTTALYLDDVVVSQCASNRSGAGLMVNGMGSTAVVTNSTFRLNHTMGGGLSGSGAAVHVLGTFSATGTSFNDNTANEDGGALFGAATATLTLDNVTFDRNVAADDGGAIYVEGSSIEITNSELTHNDADGGPLGVGTGNGDGGGLYVNGPASVQITDTDFLDNSARFGGGIEMSPIFVGTATLTGGLIAAIDDIGTEQATRGGGLDVAGGTATILGTVFEDLTVGASGGGAMYVVNDADVAVDGAAFNRNTSSGSAGGGAIYATGIVGVDLRNSDFVDNITGGAGTVYISNSLPRLSGNYFDRNTAVTGGGIYSSQPLSDVGSTYIGNVSTGAGGAIFLASPVGESVLDTVSFITNHAEDGGAISARGVDGALDLIEVAMDGNTATQSGGQLHVLSSTDAFGSVNITGASSFLNGYGALSGGAVYTGTGVSLSATDALFTNNQAGANGGAISFDSRVANASLILDGSTFRGNISDANSNGSGEGGAVWTDSGDLLFTDNNFEANDANLGGALYMGANINTFDLTRNDWCANTTPNNGGAIWMSNVGGSSPQVIQNNLFTENDAAAKGGAIHSTDSTLDIVNNTFMGNISQSGEGALYLDNMAGTFINNLVGDSSGLGLDSPSGTFTREYNAWWSNTPNHMDINGTIDDPADLDVTGGLRLVDTDPLLTDWTHDGVCSNDQLWPQVSSPLIDAGHPDAQYDDAASLSAGDTSRSDIGAYGGMSMDTTLFLDVDGDGVTLAAGDCNDDNADIFPGNIEVTCDDIDNDCDDLTPDAFDADSDGVDQCTDCDDNNDGIFPGNIEVTCDGFNNDCDDGTLDSPDLDGDGVGACQDCDDNNPLVSPLVSEVACDGIDNDCNADSPDGDDQDLDGYDECDDCNDLVASTNPGAPELPCDDLDNDCDPLTIDNPDMDRDGFDACVDCDDTDITVNPGASELAADLQDQNCDGRELCFDDLDQDGSGSASTSLSLTLACDTVDQLSLT